MSGELCGITPELSRAENLRLKHENEFMLRLVNARDTPTEPPKEQP